MDKELVNLNVTYGDVGYVVTRSDEEYRVKAGEGFLRELTNPLKTVDGTIGSHNRNYLHEKLDEWIDNAIRARGQG